MRFRTAGKANNASDTPAASERRIMIGSSTRRLGIIMVGALATATIVCAASQAPGQDQSAATPNATIYARKSVMDMISDKMDRIEAEVSSSKKIDYDAVREAADVISVLLQTFPHMFPSSTNQWKPDVPRDPADDTYAAPEVWTNYADFYQQAAAASQHAFTASRATEEGDFKASILQLRAACNSCHAVYMKTD
jgi:cytochrome c556